MCRVFSCIVTKDRRILRHSNPEVHSHESMIHELSLKEAKDPALNTWVRIECKPPDYDYTSPVRDWVVEIDEPNVPLWFEEDRDSFESMVKDATAAWKMQYVGENGRYRLIALDDSQTWIKSIIHFRNKKLDNNKGPAFISFWAPDKIRYVEYWVNDEMYRTDGPAYIEYYDDGNKKSESYHKWGAYHREDGPARITYYPEGQVKEELYMFGGEPHLQKSNNSIPYNYVFYLPDGTIKNRSQRG